MVNGANEKKVTIGSTTVEQTPKKEEDKVSEEQAMQVAVKLNGILRRGKKNGKT